MTDAYQIRTEADLREVIPEPLPQLNLKISDHIDEHAQAFIARAPLIFLATADEHGHMDVSPKGDAPGFVGIEDSTHILIPDRPGNRLTFGFRNILSCPQVSVIFVVPGVRETLRLNGTARLTRDPALLERFQVGGKAALLCTEVAVDECFFHCGKAMIRSKVWKTDTWPQDVRISFGQQMAPKMGGDDKLAQQIDESIDKNYAEELY